MFSFKIIIYYIMILKEGLFNKRYFYLILFLRVH